MSGNTDTVDRTLLPISNKTNASNNKLNAGKTNNNGKSSVQHQTDVPRQDKGKKHGNNKNIYSAPEWLNDKIKTSNENAKMQTGNKHPAVKQTEREMSTAVRYRFDGTLEKPYVFPAGLTFGPEGRKIQFRRTTSPPISEMPGKCARSNENIVEADVHRSTEDIIVEYSYEEHDQDHGEFDVQKAFFLKYDSDVSIPKDHEYHTESLDPSGKSQFENYARNTDSNSSESSLQRRWKPKDMQDGIAATRNSKRQMRVQRYKNRYSMPLKNEHFVYMGSFENVNVNNQHDKMDQLSKSSLDITSNSRNSKKESQKKHRKNRYSMPARNNDLVYMGSFENVNHLLTDNKENTHDVGLSTNNNDIDISLASDTGQAQHRFRVKEPDYSLKSSIRTRNSDTVVVNSNTSVSELNSKMACSEITLSGHKPGRESLERVEFQRSSMPNVVSSTSLSIAENNEEIACSEHEDEEYDLFDGSSVYVGATRRLSQDNLFTRQAGRTSFMPGNKRTIAPPPAIVQPVVSQQSSVTSFGENFSRSSFMPGNKRTIAPPPAIVQPVVSQHSSVTSFGENFSRSSFMPGNKRFVIPPPPCYTPPKEDVDFDQAHLHETMCNIGSQTDLSIDFDNLNMEDRDSTLNLTEVKTIVAGVPPFDRKPVHLDSVDKYTTLNDDSLVATVSTGVYKCSPKLEPPGALIDVSTASQGSDEVFRVSQNSVLQEVPETNISSFTKALGIRSQHMDRKHFHEGLKGSVYDGIRTISKEITECESTSRTSLHFSEISNKNMSSNSKGYVLPTQQATYQLQPNYTSDSLTKVQDEKPVPIPRKVHSTIHFNESSQPVLTTVQKHEEIDTKQPPVPKQRHSLNYSRSLSAAGDYEMNFVLAEVVSVEDPACSNAKLTRTHSSCEPFSTLQRRHNVQISNYTTGDATEHNYVSLNDEHFYEDIIDKQENIYEECGDAKLEGAMEDRLHKTDTMKIEKKRFDKLLLPFQKIILDSSPGLQRRNRLNQGSSTNDIFSVHLNHYSGLAYSLDQLTCVVDRHKRLNKYNNVGVGKHGRRDDTDDNSSIADDEMSMSNDEDNDEVLSQHSLRRCISADNILRNGSIVDRSMLLAKRRRKKLRERRTKSHGFPETNDFMDFRKLSNTKVNNDATKPVPKVHYSKRKATSNERLFKPKSSHTDSGHDSETFSPCTSPDARRHLGKITSLINEHSSPDLVDSSVPRQGTLPKKPWEIRLRNTQYQRKSRSRENLLTLLPI